MGGEPSSTRAGLTPTVQVWVLDLSRSTGELTSMVGVLSSGERERAGRFHTDGLRTAALASAVFRRVVVASVLGVHPRSLEFDAVCRRCGHQSHGKPRLAVPPQAGHLSFSLSHSEGVAVLATSAVEVGVDVEAKVALTDRDGLERLALTSEEREAASALSDEFADGHFLRLWTQKEAYLKGTGEGIVEGMARVSFSPSSGPWSAVLDGGAVNDWWVRPLDPDGSWVGAIAAQGARPEIVIRRWPRAGAAGPRP